MKSYNGQKTEWIIAFFLFLFIITLALFPIRGTSKPHFYDPVIRKTKLSQLPKTENIVKKIEINLSTNKLTLFENEEPIASYTVSTGKRSTPTKVGNFSVISKMPVAYGGTYGQTWTMPYWLGIYRAGVQENGIHELPFINGVRESPWSLGYSVSHGCVRLPIGKAELVYNWANLGTPVIIHY